MWKVELDVDWVFLTMCSQFHGESDGFNKSIFSPSIVSSYLYASPGSTALKLFVIIWATAIGLLENCQFPWKGSYHLSFIPEWRFESHFFFFLIWPSIGVLHALCVPPVPSVAVPEQGCSGEVGGVSGALQWLGSRCRAGARGAGQGGAPPAMNHQPRPGPE